MSDIIIGEDAACSTLSDYSIRGAFVFVVVLMHDIGYDEKNA